MQEKHLDLQLRAAATTENIDYHEVENLLKQGASPSVMLDDGKTHLITHAAESGNYTLTTLLVNSSKNPIAPEILSKAAYVALSKHSYDAVQARRLLGKGEADLFTKEQQNALLDIFKAKDSKDEGLDVAQIREKFLGSNSRSLSVRHTFITNILIDYCIKNNINVESFTPLTWHNSANNHDDIFILLVENGAKVDIESHPIKPNLRYIMWDKNIPLIKAILKADPRFSDRFYQEPEEAIDLIQEDDWRYIILLLASHDHWIPVNSFKEREAISIYKNFVKGADNLTSEPTHLDEDISTIWQDDTAKLAIYLKSKAFAAATLSENTNQEDYRKRVSSFIDVYIEHYPQNAKILATMVTLGMKLCFSDSLAKSVASFQTYGFFTPGFLFVAIDPKQPSPDKSAITTLNHELMHALAKYTLDHECKDYPCSKTTHPLTNHKKAASVTSYFSDLAMLIAAAYYKEGTSGHIEKTLDILKENLQIDENNSPLYKQAFTNIETHTHKNKDLIEGLSKLINLDTFLSSLCILSTYTPKEYLCELFARVLELAFLAILEAKENNLEFGQELEQLLTKSLPHARGVYNEMLEVFKNRPEELITPSNLGFGQDISQYTSLLHKFVSNNPKKGAEAVQSLFAFYISDKEHGNSLDNAKILYKEFSILIDPNKSNSKGESPLSSAYKSEDIKKITFLEHINDKAEQKKPQPSGNTEYYELHHYMEKRSLNSFLGLEI